MGADNPYLIPALETPTLPNAISLAEL